MSAVIFSASLIHHRQRAGEAEADRAGVRVRLRAILDGAAAEHLAAGLELDVDFEADGGNVRGHDIDSESAAGASIRRRRKLRFGQLLRRFVTLQCVIQSVVELHLLDERVELLVAGPVIADARNFVACFPMPTTPFSASYSS